MVRTVLPTALAHFMTPIEQTRLLSPPQAHQSLMAAQGRFIDRQQTAFICHRARPSLALRRAIAALPGRTLSTATAERLIDSLVDMHALPAVTATNFLEDIDKAIIRRFDVSRNSRLAPDSQPRTARAIPAHWKYCGRRLRAR